MFIKRFLLASRRYLFSSTVVASAATVQTAIASAPTEGLLTGHTSVRLSNRFVDRLAALQLLFDRIYPGKLENGVAAFPISAGTIDFANAKAEMLHMGGVAISAGPVSVQLRDFSIDTTSTKPVLTGMVVINNELVGRMPLFDLELPALDLPIDPQTTVVDIPNVKALFTTHAASTLNGIFGVRDFARGFDFGTARVKAMVAPA